MSKISTAIGKTIGSFDYLVGTKGARHEILLIRLPKGKYRVTVRDLSFMNKTYTDFGLALNYFLGFKEMAVKDWGSTSHKWSQRLTRQESDLITNLPDYDDWDTLE